MIQFEERPFGFRVRGDIDESVDFSALPDEPVELDLSGVKRINSTGIRKWVRWKDQRTTAITLREIPCSVVVELSLVPAMARGLAVRSVMAPYYDPQTDTPMEILIDSDMLQQIKNERAVPKLTAPESGVELEFEEDENNYFGFLFKGATIATS